MDITAAHQNVELSSDSTCNMHIRNAKHIPANTISPSVNGHDGPIEHNGNLPDL